MIRDLAAVVRRALGRCSCDRRFADIAHDVGCPEHGFASLTRGGSTA